MQLVVQSLQKSEETPQLRSIFINLLKQVPTSAPTPSLRPPTTTTTTTAPSSRPSKREQELETQLVSMGYNLTQAREACWATGYRGVEQAIEFLTNNT